MGAAWKARLTIVLPSSATAFSFSPDAKLIAVGHADGRVTVWETARGELVRTLTAHSREIRTLHFSPAGDKLITIGEEMQARVWSVSDWTQTDLIEDVGFSFAISPDSRWLVAQDSKQAFWLWDLKTLKREKQLVKAGLGGARDMNFTDNQHLVVVYGNDPHRIDVVSGENELIPIRIGQPKINLQQTGKDQFAISLGGLSDDNAMSHHLASRGSLVAIGRGWYGKPSFVDVVDLTKVNGARRFKPKEGGTQASFSFDGNLLAIEGAKEVTLWKLADGKQLTSVRGDGMVQFSPLSLELAVTDGNSVIFYTPN